MMDIDVNCDQASSDIKIWNENNEKFSYCKSDRPSKVTFYTDSSKWLGYSVVGNVHFSLNIEFLDHYSSNLSSNSSK